MKKSRLLKRHIIRLNYLENEYEACIEIHDEAKHDLEKTVRKLHYDLNIFDENLNKARRVDPALADPLAEDLSFDKNTSKNHPTWTKKFFRKIMMLTHPDKTSSLEDKDQIKTLEALHQQASEAMEGGDYTKILMIADKLDIEISTDVSIDFKIFRAKEETLQDKIKKIKNTIYWSWAHSSEDEKEQIVKEFLKTSGWTRPEALRKKARKRNNHPGKSISQVRKPKKKSNEK